MEKEYKPGIDYDAYDVDLMEKMYETRFAGLPLAFTLLDMRKTQSHCHETADMLVFLLENSNRVMGELPSIVGKDKRHSWVEFGEYCYDTTEGMKWKKESYYEANQPSNVVIFPREESIERMQSRVSLPESSKEKCVAFVRDLEDNAHDQLYRAFLRFYVSKFKEEKGLDIMDYDEKVVQGYLSNIQKFYSETQALSSLEGSTYSDEEFGNR